MRVPLRLAAGAAALVALGLPAAAGAAAIGVTTQADEVSAGDGCSLREAVIAANADTTGPGDDCKQGSGADGILVPASQTHYALTLTGAGEAGGDLDGDRALHGHARPVGEGQAERAD
jgi:CSLREA domain-containing protein